ncbi:MAG: hypothetical protein WBQ04_07430 [Candidatus Acidiferrales bacterium]
MRALALWILAFGIAASPAMARAAGTGDDKDSTAAKPAGTAKAATDNKTPDASSKSDAPAKPASPTMENELQQLRELLEAQSKQLQEQNDALKEQRHEMEAMQQNLRAVNAPLVNEGALPASSLAAQPAFSAGFVASPDEDKPDAYQIRFKGITITPGGFMAAETVWRQRGITNDVNTDFKATPFSGASNSKLSDFNFSGRQSRLSVLAQGKLDDVKIGGYFEGDFLSAGVTSNNNESNSYTFRQRQFWVQAAFASGWTITGGQMWSLVTETKKGVENRTEATPLTIDAQYTAGFSWARQYGLRLSKSFADNKLTLAVSMEGPQTTFGGKIQTQNTLIAAPGDLGGLYNNQANYSYNQTPDFVIKGVLEPGWGHFEVFGVVSTFRARNFPCAGATAAAPCAINGATNGGSLANNDTRTGGGIGVNARVPLLSKKVEAGFHFLGGDGVGRYGTDGEANVTARPNGTLVPLRSYQALGTLELHPTPRLDVYLNAGGEYDQRAQYTNAAGAPVGYGNVFFRNDGCSIELSPTNQNTPVAPANCQGDIRSMIEGTIGFWYRFYQGPKGRVQIGGQYSYLVKNTWTGTNSTKTDFFTPSASNNMVFTSFRYYLP